jgi:hypothetical protein
VGTALLPSSSLSAAPDVEHRTYYAHTPYTPEPSIPISPLANEGDAKPDFAQSSLDYTPRESVRPHIRDTGLERRDVCSYGIYSFLVKVKLDFRENVDKFLL